MYKIGNAETLILRDIYTKYKEGKMQELDVQERRQNTSNTTASNDSFQQPTSRKIMFDKEVQQNTRVPERRPSQPLVANVDLNVVNLVKEVERLKEMSDAMSKDVERLKNNNLNLKGELKRIGGSFNVVFDKIEVLQEEFARKVEKVEEKFKKRYDEKLESLEDSNAKMRRELRTVKDGLRTLRWDETSDGNGSYECHEGITQHYDDVWSLKVVEEDASYNNDEEEEHGIGWAEEEKEQDDAITLTRTEDMFASTLVDSDNMYKYQEREEEELKEYTVDIDGKQNNQQNFSDQTQLQKDVSQQELKGKEEGNASGSKDSSKDESESKEGEGHASHSSVLLEEEQSESDEEEGNASASSDSSAGSCKIKGTPWEDEGGWCRCSKCASDDNF